MDNIYHRYLKLPFEYPRPDHLFVKPKASYNSCVHLKDVHPEFVSWVESHGCKLSNVVEIFYTAPNGGSVPIHTDSGNKPGEYDVVKINFTWGPDDSVTRWWTVTNEQKLIKLFNPENSPSNKNFRLKGIVPDIPTNANCTANLTDVILAHEIVVNRPILFNAGQLHSTFNPNLTQDRWTLTMVPLTLDGNMISFSQALEIFKDWIE